MRFVLILTLISVFAIILNRQNSKVLVADGTKYEPDKYSRQPTIEKLSATEIADLRKDALRIKVDVEEDPQASSEETQFEKDFELLDVAKGCFVFPEIEHEALLYTARNLKLTRNYQGIFVLSRSKSGFGKHRSRLRPHYVDRYQGDKFIRNFGDINQNTLNEIAKFSASTTKNVEMRLLRAPEFSPNGIEKPGFTEIYSRVNQKQRTPWNEVGRKRAIRVYTPPVMTVSKIFVKSESAGKPVFTRQEFKHSGEDWTKAGEAKVVQVQADLISYVEVVKSIFPEVVGEK